MASSFTLPPASVGNIAAFTTKPIGDVHVYYVIGAAAVTGSSKYEPTFDKQTVMGAVARYGIVGVTQIDGLGALTAVADFHVATTTDDSQIDTTSVDAFKQITVTETTPGSALACYALSVDRRQTFLIHDGAAIRTVAQLAVHPATGGEQDVTGDIALWWQDDGVIGHFEGPLKAMEGMTANLGSNRIKIPCANHGFSSGMHVAIHGTNNYDAAYELGDQTGGDANHFIIQYLGAYVDEALDGSQYTCRRISIDHPQGFAAEAPHVDVGAIVHFADGDLTITDVGGGGFGNVTLSAEHSIAFIERVTIPGSGGGGSGTPTWWYLDQTDAWQDTGSQEPYEALRQAFAVPANRMTGAQMAAKGAGDWVDIVGYPTLDFAIGLQVDGENLPTVTKFAVKVYDSGGAEVAGRIAGNWTRGAGWTDNTVDRVPFGKNGTILYNGAGGFTADYGVIAGIPGFWYRIMMRGTAIGTSLTKVRFRAPCQPLQNIGDSQSDAPLGFVFHDTSDGKILDYTVEMSDATYTALSSAPLPMEAEDFLYVGYLTPFNEIEIIPYSENNQNVSVLTVKYWNGIAWQPLTIADGTSDQGKTLCRRGKISWTLPNNWKQNGPLEGLHLGYWLQFSVSASLSATAMLSECRIYPVPQALVKHKGAAVFQNRLALFDRPDAHGQVDISKEALECSFSGYDTYSYNLGNQITCGISAWNTLLLGGADCWSQLGSLSPEGLEFRAVEAARHMPVNSRVIVKAPLGIANDGDRYGLFFLNHYGAFCQSGLATDSSFGTSRAVIISDAVSWWDSSSTPRLDKDFLHLACGEFWPTRNWVVWSVPMILSGEGPQPTNNRLIVFDLSLRTWLPPFTMSLASLAMAYHYNPNAPGKLGSVGLYGGDYQGRILRLFGPNDATDAGEPISAWVETGWLPFGSPEYRKILRLLSIYGKSTSSPIAVAVSCDGEESPRLTLTFDDLVGLGARPFGLEQESNNVQGRFYKFRISFTGPADIYGLQLGMAVIREWGV